MSGYRPLIRIGLIGFGKVAQEFLKLIQQKLPSLPFTPIVSGIVSKQRCTFFEKQKLQPIPEILAQHSNSDSKSTVKAFLKRVNADVIFELSSLSVKDGEPARNHILSALKSNKHVISSNKGPFAFNFDELQEFALQKKLHLRFESAVAQGIPIFSIKRYSLQTAEISAIRAVLNTSANYILNRMVEGIPQLTALAEAQAAGYSEHSPELDISGWDSAMQAAVLGNALMGKITVADISRENFQFRAAEMIKKAERTGGKIKQIIHLEKVNDHIEGSVRLQIIQSDDHFFALAPTDRSIQISSDLHGSMIFTASGHPLKQAAAGLLSDLVGIYYDSLRFKSDPSLFDLTQDEMMVTRRENKNN